MKYISSKFALSVISFTFLAQFSFAQNNESIKLKTIEDTISYIIGQDLGQNFVKQNIQINPEILVKAILEAGQNKPSMISQEESARILNNYIAELRTKGAGGVKKQGEEFLEKNKSNKGVEVTSSGLQYVVMREGTGVQPKATDKVMVHYKGTLIDGTKFDASYDRGEPLTFPLNGVIKGWTEGLQLMKEGAKYKFFIPSNLGYGDQGAGPTIPGGAVLIFEVELIKVIMD